MPACFLSLGGNLGNVPTTFRDAEALLGAAECIELCMLSRTYRTSPVGSTAGDAYLNAVLKISTTLSPGQLLTEIQQNEVNLGRTRTIHWGPRTLDIDIVMYGDEIISQHDLTVPHPACWYRRFVLDPFVEVAPDVIHPTKQATFRELRDRLLQRPFHCSLAGAAGSDRQGIIDDLLPQFPAVVFSHWGEEQGASNRPPTIIAWIGESAGGSSGETRWDELPILPRLDVSQMPGIPEKNIRDVLDAALGTPEG